MTKLHLLSLGAGVQSSTLALMAAIGEVTPMPDAAIFADTGDESNSVYDWLDWLEDQLPFPVYRVRKGNKALSQEMVILRERRDGTGSYLRQPIPGFVEKKGKPVILTRGCTRDFKIRPIVTQARRLKRSAKATHIDQWYGISTDERQRVKEPPEHDFSGRWPLIEMGMSRDDCFTWMLAHGYPKPPRSACVFCPYHSDVEWARLQREEPDAFMQAVAVERAMQAAKALETKPTTHRMIFMHRSLKPLDQVQFGTSPGQFCSESRASCGV